MIKSRLFDKILIGCIRGYQLVIGPLLAPHCRFYPSCSCYAMQAIEVHGGVWGSWLSLKRLLKCHPWHLGGYDPVPVSSRLTTRHGE